MSIKIIKKLLKPYQDKNAKCRITFKRAGEKKLGHVNISERWGRKVINKLMGVPEIEEVFLEFKNKTGEWEKE